MQESDNVTQHGKAFVSDGLWPSDYFFFPKLKEHLSGTRFSSNSDVKIAAESWFNGQGRHFYPMGPGMMSYGVILMHGNTQYVRKTRELLQKFKWEV
ncbi:hypothetical protein AVEN_26768-1 [Araneus ventricosus]|uniref:Uncharacterized protein n=1 Tax=Araneus ventricosus TaxID=182803 RepID=A0A4Y2D520_ARAVE|nr:hypothetical protein AVEN_26768-1 [Araneus ventricosus]